MLVTGTLAVDCGSPRESALFSQASWVVGDYSKRFREAPIAVQFRVV